MPTLLVTAFGPYLEHEENASAAGLALATPTLPNGWQLVRQVIDVAWQRGPEALLDAIDGDTALVIAFGQADEDALRVERFAVNAASREVPDIDGDHFTGTFLEADGPPAVATELPWQALLEQLAAANVPAVESHYPGSYLCNCTFYRLMRHVGARIPAGFVHVPPLAKMPVEIIARGMEVVMEGCLAEMDQTT
jgi:pyroglutamyl-peptidase